MVSLPRPLRCHTPLQDQAGNVLGELVKVWPTIRDSTPARVRISPRTACMPEYEYLRDDLLTHRRNLAIDADGRLLLVDRIDTYTLSAAAAETVQRSTPWPSAFRIVS
jgi:hypothetical protein